MTSARPVHESEHELLAAVSDVVLEPNAGTRAAARRASTRIRRLNHHAFYCKDIEETTRFYQDILELKLVNCMQLENDPENGRYYPYAHVFFELSDASWIAFFDAPLRPGEVGPDLHAFDHHFALTVDSLQDIEYFKDKLDKAHFGTIVIDHGFCISLYVRDPNNMNLELTWVKPLGEDYFLKSEQAAPAAMQKWLTRRQSIAQERASAAATTKAVAKDTVAPADM